MEAQNEKQDAKSVFADSAIFFGAEVEALPDGTVRAVFPNRGDDGRAFLPERTISYAREVATDLHSEGHIRDPLSTEFHPDSLVGVVTAEMPFKINSQLSLYFQKESLPGGVTPLRPTAEGNYVLVFTPSEM